MHALAWITITTLSIVALAWVVGVRCRVTLTRDNDKS